jgi:hypothetical protein
VIPGASKVNVEGPGTAFERSILPNWCGKSEMGSCSQLTEVTPVNPVKANVWKLNGGLNVVTGNVSVTALPPANVPVNVTVGGGS